MGVQAAKSILPNHRITGQGEARFSDDARKRHLAAVDSSQPAPVSNARLLLSA